MKRILVTGATGNIGVEVIRFLFESKIENHIIAGVRDIAKAKKVFANFPRLNYVEFDFENYGTFNRTLENIDTVFLLRPPHISDVSECFSPLLEKIKQKGITEVVFLSVQGADFSSMIPHNKIEKLIQKFRLNYIFLRPSYFMQNITTTLLSDIKNKRQIILPSAKAKFNWIDVVNIGETAAILLNDFDKYKNQTIDLTGSENENFSTIAYIINEVVEKKIMFVNTNPFKFYKIKKKEGMEKGMIMVMIFLHFLPRFQKEPRISNFYSKLTGKKPTTLMEFMKREKEKFNSPIVNSRYF